MIFRLIFAAFLTSIAALLLWRAYRLVAAGHPHYSGAFDDLAMTYMAAWMFLGMAACCVLGLLNKDSLKSDLEGVGIGLAFLGFALYSCDRFEKCCRWVQARLPVKS